ncbi:hypothetical protein IFM89_018962 [Coptis chinensis]|uniref:Gamma-interferon-inducible lysosomal thiol reductase n=1 Tax=Coptis chinensis TaxID=261450 RepID=A0A835LYN5_9MAGN|nr:hypothetical protein IFM89_018962 [Coptis chinensis]
MASCGLLRHAIVMSYLALFILLNVSAAPKKVKVALYYETLCPACSNFMVNNLSEIFRNELINIIDLNLVPYGNAKLHNTTITCQHGPDECFLNTVEACAIHAWPDLNEHYRFIYCIESLVIAEQDYSWDSCFEKTGLPRKPVDDCYYGKTGQQLEVQYAKETDSLKPPHEYVPWVTVNDRPLKENYTDFMSYVCNAYEQIGDHTPRGCRHLPHQVISKAKENEMKLACYAEEKAT